MQAGKLRNRVIIQRDTGTTVGAGGHVVPDWTTLYSRWCSVHPRGSREFFRANQVQADITHRIVMRAGGLDGVTTKDRIKFGSRIFQIAGPPIRDDEDRQTSLSFACKETP